MSPKKKVFIFSSVHPWDDVRVYHKQAVSLSYLYDVELHAVADFAYKRVDNIAVYGVPRYDKRYKRPLLWWSLLKRAVKARADIYHFHDPELIPIGLIIKFLTGKPIIYDVHEDYPAAILSREWIPVYMRRFIACVFDRFEKLAGRWFDAVIVVTDELQRAFNGSNVTVVQNFPLLSIPADVETQIEARKQHGQHVSIVYAGALTRIRGIYETVKAFEYIPRDMNVHMTLAGSFDDEGYKQEVLDYISNDDRINYVGQLNYRDAYELMYQSDIGVICFKPVPHHTRSLSNKMFEYMSVGIPVVASNFPLWYDIIAVNDCGIMVDPLDSQQIAQAIMQLAKDPAERARMGMNGYRAYKEKYNWAAQEKKLLDVYGALLKDERG